MFHIVSKIFTFFLMPAGIICILLLYALFSKDRGRSKKSLLFAFIFFYLSSTPVIVDEVLRLWEASATPISEVKPHDIGILLTGGVMNSDKTPKENIFLGGTGDRAWQTLHLYKSGKIKKVIISGGNVLIFGKTPAREIDQIARFLIINGIKRQDIYLEDRSTNTRENTLNMKTILQKQFPSQTCILITSAFHMKRAAGCFAKVGIKVTPYGSNYLSPDRVWSPVILVPDGQSAWKAHLMAREILGYISYRAFGWI